MQTSPSPEELAAVLQPEGNLSFDLPNPEDEEISDLEFAEGVDRAWTVCDRFDLQTDIWRGRILRAVRDREKRGGEGRGQGFMKWLRDRDVSKTQAYNLIQLADSADALLADGRLVPEAIDNFSKRAFVEVAQAPPEIQKLVGDAAREGDRITRKEVRQLSDEWVAVSSELLPVEIREKAADRTLPSKQVAPLARELEKLPEIHQAAIQREAAAEPDLDNLKQLTLDARSLSKYLDAAARVQALRQSSVDVEMALEEALRVDCLSVASDLVNQSAQLEQAAAKLFTTWKRLSGLADRLYVDTGASTPNLRSLISCLERLTGRVVEVSLDEAGENTVRLQILE